METKKHCEISNENLTNKFNKLQEQQQQSKQAEKHTKLVRNIYEQKT